MVINYGAHKGQFFPAIDPLRFLVDDEIRPFLIDKRHDLTGTGREACPQIAEGIFIVHEHRVPQGVAEIVMGVFPHVWQRTGSGNPDESYQLIPYEEVAGFVLFDTTKDDNQPFLVETDYNIATVAARPNDRGRQQVRGTTFISENLPSYQQLSMGNPLQTIHLPPGSVFRVLFRLAPALPVDQGGIPNPFVIGNLDDNETKRLDFAGAAVVGLRMPAERYDKLKTARRLGQLGPEASASSSPPGTLPGIPR